MEKNTCTRIWSRTWVVSDGSGAAEMKGAHGAHTAGRAGRVAVCIGAVGLECGLGCIIAWGAATLPGFSSR